MLRASIIIIGLAVTGAAQAQPVDDAAPTLKRSVTVVRDVVRIGDLVDNAGDVADVPIFRSPDPGTTGSVSTSTVLAALKPHNLSLTDSFDVGQIEVTRAARVIAAKDIELRVARAFAGQYGLPDADKVAAVFDNELRTLYLDPAVTGDLQVARARYEPRSKRFDITLVAAPNGGGRQVPLRFTGSLFEPADVVVVSRALARGEVLRPSDVTLERRPKAEVAPDVANLVDDVVGFAARQPLRPGQLVRRTDLAKPEVVKRDETVTLIFQAPGVLLTMRGKALESGAEGDVITVQNVQSKRNVQGSVSGPGRVTVAPSMPTVSFSAEAARDAESRAGQAE